MNCENVSARGYGGVARRVEAAAQSRAEPRGHTKYPPAHPALKGKASSYQYEENKELGLAWISDVDDASHA